MKFFNNWRQKRLIDEEIDRAKRIQFDDGVISLHIDCVFGYTYLGKWDFTKNPKNPMTIMIKVSADSQQEAYSKLWQSFHTHRKNGFRNDTT